MSFCLTVYRDIESPLLVEGQSDAEEASTTQYNVVQCTLCKSVSRITVCCYQKIMHACSAYHRAVA